MKLANKIEAILFFKGEPMSSKKLASILKVTTTEIDEAANELSASYEGRGFVLIKNTEEYSLGTTPELSDLIEEMQKEELNKSLTKASLETLTIILYKNGASRSTIDYIRGVNSSFTLRALSMRGLVEKVTDPKDTRRYIYQPTTELLAYMGVTRVEDLPEFENIKHNFVEAEKNLENNTQES
ncbi:MAG: SMC-Scp complex subunit ScpB [Candidatus Pacebacteria bacterium]|nr:SMC-Scp complex subunit ScpB [Candidatus Paceibacterota bacterium]MBP9851254.1 SMC-Scp complex subunit ScpB [Candidatus Paceibacterota bacterium]